MHGCAYFSPLIIFLAVLFSLPAFSQNYDIPKVVAVQSRSYYLKDELAVHAGYLPLDSFTRYVDFGGEFTHFFSDFFGWEIINASYTASISTGLEQELKNTYGALSDDRFDVLQYFGTTNLVFTPFYTKNLLFDSHIVYGETSFVVGAGISKYDSGNVNTADIGIIFRFVMTPATSLKFDAREYVYFSGNSKSNLVLNAGFAYNFGTNDLEEIKKDSDD